MEKIGIVGSGAAATALAKGFSKYGYDVMIGSRDKLKREQLQNETGVSAGSFEEAASFGDIVVLAIKGLAAEETVLSLSGLLKGKTVIDVTNPIAEKPPLNGVLSFFTSLEESLLERLQKAAPEARFVKAFNSIGNPFMVDPPFEPKPTMFICGRDTQAKNDVSLILEKFGWEIEDMGNVEAARAIEPLCILWCIPGFLSNRWNNAFKLLKPKDDGVAN